MQWLKLQGTLRNSTYFALYKNKKNVWAFDFCRSHSELRSVPTHSGGTRRTD